MTVALVDPALLGTDIRMVEDVDPAWGIASGFACLARALARRLITDRGGLFYDLAYGFNLTNLVNAGWTPRLLQKTQQDVAAEVRKDERVRAPVRATVTLNEFAQSLRVEVFTDTEAGPFAMVMAVSAVTVDILRVNGVEVAETIAAAAAPTTVVTVVGGGGEQGAAGPPGPAGGAQLSVSFGDAIWSDDASGDEKWVVQQEVNMGSLPGSVTVEISAQVRSTSGTAIFRLRLGGGDGTEDGTVIATITSSSASFEEKLATSSFTNPTGLKRLKITVESSGVGQNGEISGMTVTFR